MKLTLNNETNLLKSRADNWLDNILNSLANMQVYLDYMTLGASDIFELFNEKGLNVNFAEVQSSNLKYFFNESRKLLINSSKILVSGYEKQILELFKELSDLNKKYDGFVITKRINSKNEYNTILKPSFNDAKHICNKIREKFVNGLWELISPSTSEFTNRTPRK